LGSDDFLDWFEAEDSKNLAERLCESYQVNGQTAWSLLRKAERFDIRLITKLTERDTKKMRLSLCGRLLAAHGNLGRTVRGFVIPLGARCLIKT
jgi:hypothetical protein